MTIRHELDAAGVRDPRLRDSYRRCRQLNAAHGRTYFLATRMLSARQRPAIHALYGFARRADDIVDDPAPRRLADRATALDELAEALRSGLDAGRSTDPVLAALVDTVARYGIDQDYFTAFLASMRADLTTTSYPTRAGLDAYVHGSAEVIGLQILPVLGLAASWQEAAPRAAALGKAFQLTNFLRDVGEDLDRGRVYLPADELAVFDVDRDRLLWCRRAGRPDRRVREALSDQVARTHAVYRYAQPGIAMLDPVARPCVTTAFTLYREILDRVVASGYDVFARRVAVGRTRRASVAAMTLGASVAARVHARLSGRTPGRISPAREAPAPRAGC